MSFLWKLLSFQYLHDKIRILQIMSAKYLHCQKLYYRRFRNAGSSTERITLVADIAWESDIPLVAIRHNKPNSFHWHLPCTRHIDSGHWVVAQPWYGKNTDFRKGDRFYIQTASPPFHGHSLRLFSISLLFTSIYITQFNPLRQDIYYIHHLI